MGFSSSFPIFVSFLIFSIILTFQFGQNYGELVVCGSDQSPSQRLIFVSTLDGQISALDSLEGTHKWTYDTGSPLLSSNIHRLELTNAGQWARLVPSLGGTLYRFCGENLEPLPLTADQLLSSSYKYSDDLAIAGAKDSSTIGISSETGRVVYECSVRGCVNGTNLPNNHNKELGVDELELENSRELLLIRRTTQTVRAADPRTGQEKWNFSVGQHELILQPFEGCALTANEPKPEMELIYKVIVPEGLICAVQKNAPHNIVWKYKLKSPIVNAWHMEGSTLQPIDLFGTPFIPNTPKESHVTPAVYIGMHKRQLYIQESVRMQTLVQSLSKRYLETNTKPFPVIPWKPYPARFMINTVEDSKALATISEKEISTTALSVLYASEYINGNGYYLYSDTDLSAVEGPICETNTTEVPQIEYVPQNESLDDFEWVYEEHFIDFLFRWWKEVLMIAVTTAVFVNILSQKIRGKTPPIIQREYVIVERVENVPTPLHIPPPVSNQSDSPTTPFISRYLTDFSPIKCLGRGGFGVVFEAKNKIDDCSYAIKRITLPNKTEKRERVLREVRALAKLDHNNIVRYFNAWLEEPPFGWIDPYEKEFKTQMELTDTYSKQNSVSSKFDNTTNKEKADKNICISMNSDTSIDEGCDALEYDKRLCEKNDALKRSRSYSVAESVSIVFENEASNATECISDDDEKIEDVSGNRDKNDESSYIQFADNTNERSTAQSNSDDFNKPSQRLTKGHRRNFSLDSHNFQFNRRICDNIYLYIQMQLCKAESLSDWLKENKQLSVRKQQYVGIFEQIVCAVEYVHMQSLIHRDLKPSNIFFSTEGQIKIGDFGLVTTMSDSFYNESNNGNVDSKVNNSKHTKYVGTHLYMSPEQLRGEAHNFKVDIWSLGLVLIELLVPFNTEMERVNVLKALREQKFPDGFCSQFPDEHALLRLMLSQDPNQRPTTFGIRALPPLCHKTDPQYHYSLPPRSSNSSSSSL